MRASLPLLLAAVRGSALPNVLYILADDMNAELGVFGGPAVTPNLDRLAAEGLAFPRAFCQISVCSPSRQSFLTGRRPDTHGVWNFIDANPLNTSATPGYFRDAGYLSLGLGKTFHEAAGAWNAGAYWNTSFLPYFPYATNACPHGGEGGGHCTLPDEAIWDWKLLNASLAYLDAAAAHAKQTGAPFFLMTGFRACFFLVPAARRLPRVATPSTQPNPPPAAHLHIPTQATRTPPGRRRRAWRRCTTRRRSRPRRTPRWARARR